MTQYYEQCINEITNVYLLADQILSHQALAGKDNTLSNAQKAYTDALALWKKMYHEERFDSSLFQKDAEKRMEELEEMLKEAGRAIVFAKTHQEEHYLFHSGTS